MSVDRETTLKMARAAQLSIPPDEVDKMMESINDILDFCSLVGDLDTDGVPDFTWRMNERARRRSDVEQVWSDRDAFLGKAPSSDGDFFKVPRIIAGEKE